MQSPTASDPSFKAFLEKLQEHNNRGFASQLVQLKAERENAGEDNDKREKQLDDVISSLKEVRSAVTGIKIDVDLTPLVNIGENQTKLLEELNKEISLTRKLTEGSVEYDKEAAQYRNTSGRDIESKVSGKTSKDGGFIDFETARDTLSGQGKRVKEDNAFSLKPISYTPGKTVAAAVGGKTGKAPINEEEEKSKYQGFFKEIESGFKYFMTDGLSEKPGHGIFQTPSKEVESKDKEPKVSSPRQENPEADNVASTGEIEADAAKSDLEISKQMLDTTKAQLVELKGIREALAPKTPKDLPKQKSTPTATTEASDRAGGGGFDLPGFGGGGKMGKLGGGLMAAGKAALPWAAAAGVAVAGGAAVDYGLGKLGVGKDKEGNDLQVDTAQDDANWAKMTMGQKIQSGLARGIEKTGSALFLGNLSKEAQATRIKKETDYLNKNTPGAATKEALAAPLPAVNEKEATAATPAAAQQQEKVKFRKSKVDQEVIGGSTIAGYERGYKLEGLEDDIKAAEAAWAKFNKAERADDKAGMDAAANEFIQLANKIESPEYKTKMREISAKQNSKKEEKVTGGPGAKNPAVPTPEVLSANQILAQKNVARAKEKAALVAPTGNGSGSLQSGQLPIVEKKPVDTAVPGKDTAVVPKETVDGKKVKPVTDVDKAQKAAKEKYQTSTSEEKAASEKLKAFEKENPFDYREKPTATQDFLEMPGTGKFKDPKKQEEYNNILKAKEKASDSKKAAGAAYTAAEGVTKTQTFTGGVQPVKPGDKGGIQGEIDSEIGGMQSDGAKIEALKKRGYTDKDLGRDDNLKQNYIQMSDGAKYPNKNLGLYEAIVKKELDAPINAKAKDGQVVPNEAVGGKSVADAVGTAISKPTDSSGKVGYLDEMKARGLNPSDPDGALKLGIRGPNNAGYTVANTSTENADMGREAGKGGSNNTVVSNNVSSNNTTKIVPMKANPRPEYTGSSLDRYTNRITVY